MNPDRSPWRGLVSAEKARHRGSADYRLDELPPDYLQALKRYFHHSARKVAKAYALPDPSPDQEILTLGAAFTDSFVCGQYDIENTLARKNGQPLYTFEFADPKPAW
jgi:hypothetical protein